MFFVKQMRLIKITIDNSVKYIPKSELTKIRDSKTKTLKIITFLVNKTKNYHKTIKMDC